MIYFFVNNADAAEILRGPKNSVLTGVNRMIHLEKLTYENFDDVLELKVKKSSMILWQAIATALPKPT